MASADVCGSADVQVYAGCPEVRDDNLVNVASRSENPVSNRIFKTVCLYVSFGTLGLCSPLVGTTLVHMERLFDTDTATMSWTFTFMAVGYLCGALVCGFTFDRFRHELQLIVANGVEAVVATVASFFTKLPLFIGVLYFQSCAMGFIDASGQSYCVGLWSGHRYKDSILQAVHAIWSLGATIGPFIIGRFLVDLPPANMVENTSASVPVDTTAVPGISYNITGESSSHATLNVTSDVVSYSEIAIVRYAYVTIGSIVFVSSILYTAAYLHDRRTQRVILNHPVQMPLTQQTTDNDGSEETVDSKLAKREKLMTYVFVAQLFLFYHIYAYIELIPSNYFAAFAIKFLQWPVRDASLLLSVFYGSHFAGRVLGVPLALVLRPRTMIVVNLLLTTVAYMMLLGVRSIPELLWASAALAGSGMATTFATMILWTAQFVPITGQVASIMIAGSSLGSIIAPQIVGRLFDWPAAGGPMSIVYILVTVAVLHVVLFSVMSLFVVYWHPHDGSKRAGSNGLPAMSTTIVTADLPLQESLVTVPSSTAER